MKLVKCAKARPHHDYLKKGDLYIKSQSIDHQTVENKDIVVSKEVSGIL